VVVQRNDLDASTVKAKELAIADNRVAELDLDWDADVLRALLEEDVSLKGMFDDDELAALLARPHHEGQTDANAVPEARTTGITRGDMFTLGDHVLLCGDSTNPADVARVMGGQRADCVFTSPPYGVGIEYGGYVDTLDNLRAMLPTLAVQWCDVVVDGGFAVVNFGDILSGKDAAGSAVRRDGSTPHTTPTST
jgi:hypothetical protein